jgi:hypothetical protein
LLLRHYESDVRWTNFYASLKAGRPLAPRLSGSPTSPSSAKQRQESAGECPQFIENPRRLTSGMRIALGISFVVMLALLDIWLA